MSKKSHPGDGSHGKGVKGMRTPFDDLFQSQATTQRRPEQEIPVEDEAQMPRPGNQQLSDE